MSRGSDGLSRDTAAALQPSRRGRWHRTWRAHPVSAICKERRRRWRARRGLGAGVRSRCVGVLGGTGGQGPAAPGWGTAGRVGGGATHAWRPRRCVRAQAATTPLPRCDRAAAALGRRLHSNRNGRNACGSVRSAARGSTREARARLPTANRHVQYPRPGATPLTCRSERRTGYPRRRRRHDSPRAAHELAIERRGRTRRNEAEQQAPRRIANDPLVRAPPPTHALHAQQEHLPTHQRRANSRTSHRTAVPRPPPLTPPAHRDG